MLRLFPSSEFLLHDSYATVSISIIETKPLALEAHQLRFQVMEFSVNRKKKTFRSPCQQRFTKLTDIKAKDQAIHGLN
jgi:hypothetical protein